MDLYEELLGVVDTLSAHGVQYALCGGIAVAVHGYPRFTKDIDLLIREEDLDATRAAVAECGFTVEGGRIPFRMGQPDEQIVFRINKVSGRELLTLDLILVGEPLKAIWNDRRDAEWENRRICLVSREGLAVMKRRAGRRQDLLDLEKLGFEGKGDSDGSEETAE